MRVLVACEYSGTVRDAFTAVGAHAVSCDLLPTEAPGIHYQGDVAHLLDGWEPVQFTGECDPDGDGWCVVRDCDPDACQCIGPTMDGAEYKEVDGVLLGRPVARPHWDLMIAHPPCTYLAVSGLHWNKRDPERAAKTEAGLDFVRLLMNAPIPRIAVENPISCISSRIRKPDQIIQPWMFGHDASKATCLWLKGLPLLQHHRKDYIQGRVVGEDKRGKTIVRYANQTDSGQNRLGPSDDRWKIRSETYAGIARAMAEQWGNELGI